MSADNGYVIQMNDKGKYTLQMYFASNDEYPVPNEASQNEQHSSMEKAVTAYADMDAGDSYLCEYGLTINGQQIKNQMALNEAARQSRMAEPWFQTQKEKKVLDIQKFTRKPFDVDAVQVTQENLEEVAFWCNGHIQPGMTHDRVYIKVHVQNVIRPRQEQAYVGDWILSTPNGFKVYTPGAFKKHFQEAQDSEEGEVHVIKEARPYEINVFSYSNTPQDSQPIEVSQKDSITGKR